MTTLLLVRHGETDWNRERRWQGHADPPLNDLGREQARLLGESLASREIGALWSSDLVRARETAEVVARRLGLSLSCDPRLREVDIGEWSGLTSAEIERLYPEALRRQRHGGTGWETGETYETMGARVLEALGAIARAHPGRRVLVVTHGGPIRSVWLACGGGLDSWPGAANCGVHEVAFEAGRLRWRDRWIDSTRGGLHQQVQG